MYSKELVLRKDWPDEVERRFMVNMFLINEDYHSKPVTRDTVELLERKINGLIKHFRAAGFATSTEEGVVTEVHIEYDEYNKTTRTKIDVEPFLKLVEVDE